MISYQTKLQIGFWSSELTKSKAMRNVELFMDKILNELLNIN